ncbi:uncharacterized protein LOC111636073 [Centruroides sculpturatus]|uniref:uncharacterized protein LOC111636073 n=1 Tax=Centruroides sculpturatus TaxID=218467 RepID=UPI000C6ED22F|nr:uncharacterized protein LOC111636073 [Centruroides sculpturatus]
MLSNVEIKAKISDYESVLKATKKICGDNCEILRQEDTYFNVPIGRMKFRQVEGKSSMLVFYDRPNSEEPKLSNYWKQTFANKAEADGLKEVLSQALGLRGIVKKERLLYLIDNTRVHLDKVENLGSFLELEVVLSEGQNTEFGQNVAFSLMEKLGVRKDDLLPCSYIDLIMARN